MHRCGSSRAGTYSHAGSIAPCSCGIYEGIASAGGGGTSSFTILFDMPNKSSTDEETLTDPYTYYSSSSSCSSPVDCTLSLGTASTRQSGGRNKSPQRNSTSSCMPTIYWDILSQAKHTPSSSRGAAAGGGGSGSLNTGSDPLLARRCANCNTTSTPLWRNGPRGPKSLCNACGIRYKKEERRAAATMAPYPSSAASPSMASPAVVEPQQQRHVMGYSYSHDHPWAYSASHQSGGRKTQSISISSSSGDFRIVHGNDGSGRWSDDNDGEEDASLPYLSWCLNVPPPRAEFLHH